MALPRFTSGRVGNLEFSHLNEAFDRIESREAMQSRGRQPSTVILLAQLTQQNDADEFAWAEVRRSDDGSYSPSPNGITSTREGDPFAFAAVSLTGGSQVGDIVAISPRRTAQGKLWYSINGGSGTVSRSFIITESIAHPSRSDMWAYKARPVDRTIQSGYGGVWTPTSALEYILVNGAENPADGSSIGVGTVPPSGVQYVRRPIKVGTVVVASNINNDWVFSIPNGYSFICT